MPGDCPCRGCWPAGTFDGGDGRVEMAGGAGGCVARQYASRYSAMCSHASSSWFSSRITSNMSGGHCDSFSAATIWTLRLRAWLLPRDLINRCRTCDTNRVVRKFWSGVGRKGPFCESAAELFDVAAFAENLHAPKLKGVNAYRD